jgi:hypothetical protein
MNPMSLFDVAPVLLGKHIILFGIHAIAYLPTPTQINIE